MVVVNLLLLPRRARYIDGQSQALQDRITLNWDDRTLTFGSPRGEQRLPWSDFTKWADDADGLMLYANDLLFYIFPARDVSVEHRAELRRRLVAHDVPEWRAWHSPRRR